jgi:hypothetical protein
VTGLTCDWISLPKYLDLASQRPVSLMAIQVGKPCLVPGNPASFSPVSPTEGSCPMALGSSCSPPPPPPQIAPGTLFNSKPTSHVLFPHQQHQQQQHSNNTTKALHVGHVVYASTFSLDRAAHPLIPPHFGRVHADTPQAQSHTHSTEELGRKRPASASATTASESFGHFSFVSCFNYQGYLSFFPSDFAGFQCSHMPPASQC